MSMGKVISLSHKLVQSKAEKLIVEFKSKFQSMDKKSPTYQEDCNKLQQELKEVWEKAMIAIFKDLGYNENFFCECHFCLSFKDGIYDPFSSGL